MTAHICFFLFFLLDFSLLWSFDPTHMYTEYSIYPEYLDRHHLAKSVDPEQTAPNEHFDRVLHCLPFRH